MDEIEIFEMSRAWLSTLEVGELPARHLADDLLLVPVQAQRMPAAPMLHAADALRAGLLRITECRRTRVDTLRLRSSARCPVYVPHGMALEGGAQNRIVDLPVLLEAFGEATVAVSCVERRRWDLHRCGAFEHTSEVPWSLRSSKLARQHHARTRGRRRASDQADTWQDVRRVLGPLAKASPTEDLLAAPGPAAEPDLSVLDGAAGLAVVTTRARVLGVEVAGSGPLRDILLRKALRSLQRDQGSVGGEVRTPVAFRAEVAAALAALGRPMGWSFRAGHGLVTVDATTLDDGLSATLVAAPGQVLQLSAWTA